MSLLEPYLQWIRLGLVIVASLVIAFAVVTVKRWHADSLRVQQVETELSDLKAAQKRSQEASQGLQDELEKLRAARKPSRSVRLCQPANTVSKTGAGHHDSTAGTGELSQTVGRDIGPSLYAIADDADELAARLRACQALLR